MARISPEGPDGKVKGQAYFVDSPSGRKIEYRLLGRCGADDPVLLVLHGMVPAGFGPATTALRLTRKNVKGDPKGKTEQVIDQLPFKIVGLARPGYDGSTLNKSFKDMTYEDQCTDIIAVMDDVGATQFAITANSSGGMSALTVAYKHPDRVIAMQLNCCDANYGPGFPKGKKLNEEIAEGAPITYVDGGTRPGSCMWICCCLNPCCCCCACCYKGFFMDSYIETGPAPYRLEDIKCPVAIIAGKADDQVDTNTSRFHASKLPNATLEVIDGMGHCEIPGELFERKMSELHALATGTQVTPLQSHMS
mmetsp:Transcript_139629/g.389467  ORF Transcript_139629/g.389467 Transcript_139629/m.389467 type:complete len:307 (+) Transcript_139629:109-1029(+)|eukprot:CAMPEP_0179076654 /NCGR_PEP_ID=MMETSP0796-20121207/34212_1 /TAXON_ID=73915 /ORGANISM="Pyrodinium bahamense, Strain pbaha01" /LENGTH=306 /DNA_ID=CAMNT_0020773913 /DNA_START=107 /DNA_END=1027 /DNA_ORIENTATION=+